ncbi:transposase (plasmid) [Streptomyces sp. NBC_01187]|nr:transposase [Streptomyces sp. NBC_01187]
MDGTMMDTVVDNLLAETSIRYGGYGGIAHHLVSDTYVALFSRFIPCGEWEAAYLIDSLVANESEVKPETVHADTQGQSFPVFGLGHLLGIDLPPRIRNFQDLTFHRPGLPGALPAYRRVVLRRPTHAPASTGSSSRTAGRTSYRSACRYGKTPCPPSPFCGA